MAGLVLIFSATAWPLLIATVCDDDSEFAWSVTLTLC